MYKKSLLKLFFVIIAFFCFTNVYAQQNIFRLPQGLPKPSWYNKVDWSNPNIKTIDSLIAAYKKSNEHISKHYRKEEFREEEPYITAYLRWRNEQMPFIKKDGSIKIIPNYYKKIGEQLNKNLAQRNATAANWTPLGPLETFEQGTGNKSNTQTNIYSIAVSHSNPNIIYAGSETGVLFKSTNKGINWASVNDDLLAVNGITAVAVSPTNSNVLYYYNAAGLFKSTNGGANFARLNNYTFGEINRIVFNEITGRILVASENGVYYSDDAGVAWTLATGSNAGTTLYDIAKKGSNPNTIYAVGTQASTQNLLLFVSTDGGNTFASNTLNNGGSLITCEGARLTTTAANNDYVYCVSLQPNSAPVILGSTNSGISWTVRAVSTSISLVGSNVSVGLGMSNGQGYYDLDIVASNTNAEALIVGTTSTYKSLDGGVNFSPVGGYFGTFGSQVIHPDVQMMQAVGSDTYIASDGGIVYSNDFFTANTNVINKGLTGTQYWGFGQGWDQDIVVGGRYHNGDAVLYEGYGAGNSLLLAGGESATGHVMYGKKNIVGFSDINTKKIPDVINGAVTNGAIQNTIWPQTDYYGFFPSKLMNDPRYANVFFVGEGNILWKSKNSGISYIALKDFGSKVWRFDIARKNPNYIYVCTQANGIQKTTDGGITWTVINLPTGVIYQYYNADIAINPLDENDVYFSMKDGATGNKIFRTINAGANWVNVTGATLANKDIAYILYHGNNGAVYAITNTISSEVFFKDNSMADWSLFLDGLPRNLQVWGGCGIFFRDNKLRIPSNRGIWQTTLATDVLPVAQPMADKQIINCSKDTVYFNDYSILNYTGATWQWSFPGASYISSTSSIRPKVLYPAPGNYNVTLSVTDALGQSNSKTVTNMISFNADICKADTVAGRSLIMKGTNTPIAIGSVPINSNNFSLSCWFKPDGNQISFAHLLGHDPYITGGYGFGLGFTFSGYTPNLRLCYTDNTVNYSNSSNLIATDQKWNYVVLTYSPTGVKIYLNGKSEVVNANAMAAIDLSQSPFFVNRDIHNQGGFYKGQIDEVKIYNYALSEQEVREKMHLIPTDLATETGLLNYCQFNQYDPTSNDAYEIINSNTLIIPDNTFINETGEAPVGPGKAFTINNVNTGGLKDFVGTGIKTFFKPFVTGITYPNGTLVGTKLNVPPHTKPNSLQLEPKSNWFFIENYGTNATFTSLDSIRFDNVKITPAIYSQGNFKLYKRASTEDGNTWGNEQDSSDRFDYASGANSSIVFSANNNINSFSQFAIVSKATIGVLPIRLLSFNVNANTNTNTFDIAWRCYEDFEFQKYELERSEDGFSFSSIASILKNTTLSNGAEKQYSFNDKAIIYNKKYFYRLKIINTNSSYTYSFIQTGMIKSNVKESFKLFPNPCKDFCYITLNAKQNDQPFLIKVFDAQGKLVIQVNESVNIGNNTILLNLVSLQSGIYSIKIFSNDEINYDIQQISLVK